MELLNTVGLNIEYTERVLPFELPHQRPKQTIPAQLETVLLRCQ